MAHVVFYEKPGCAGNARQKKLLVRAGHTLTVKDLLRENWSQKPNELQAFFAGLPVYEWFNRSAPAIKQGLVDPGAVDADRAIALMIAEPILIRRPLMQVGSQRVAGFDEESVDRWISLSGLKTGADLENCPKSQEPVRCHE
ncbi:MAG: ArsC/Spx/MgsR family protein [Gammaproteobacteria bacterium]